MQLVTALLLLIVASESAMARAGDRGYAVTGKDSFSIGAGDIHSEVTYVGKQTLSLSRVGKMTRYVAKVTYTRSDGTASSDATAQYVADVMPSGDMLDSADRDPDYLTVLNQPFAARLDLQTLKDLRHLSGVLPFDFPSPFTGSSLHGYLAHVGGGMIGPRHAIGVRFEAAGTMKGALPDRPGLTLNGTIAMRGNAYYDARDAELLSLETTVTISGNVSNRSGKDPVTITYRRRIRADVPERTQNAKTP
ncbi:MAG: hypothetical protein IAI50_13115 [Candidatus Eremiobacteraeota bacterium]|nr:hypothetical protein [Candidatus Eremiobacteraeota bacterium]